MNKHNYSYFICRRCKREMHISLLGGLCAFCYCEVKKANKGSATMLTKEELKEAFNVVKEGIENNEDVEWLIKEGWKPDV